MSEPIAHRPFSSLIDVAPQGAGFAMDGYWLWCGSVARDDDGLYHCYAARWPAELPFFSAYQCYSEIVHGTAVNPEGPYEFRDVTLADRGPDYWDGRMTHNPVIIQWRGTWYLFYIGTTFPGPKPDGAALAAQRSWPWYHDIRIGVACADHPGGPWRRSDRPLLVPQDGAWDAAVVTNPSPCIGPDDRLYLYYRSNVPDRGCRLGLAIFDDLDEEPVYRSSEPLFDWDGMAFEDPFIHHNGDHFEMIAKDLTGAAVGELHACAQLLSSDGKNWQLADQPLAYSREIAWDDGQKRRMANVERPFVLHDERGHATHIFAAMSEGGESRAGGFDAIERSWNGVIRLRRPGQG